MTPKNINVGPKSSHARSMADSRPWPFPSGKPWHQFLGCGCHAGPRPTHGAPLWQAYARQRPAVRQSTMHHNLHARVAKERVLVGRAHGRARIVMPLSMRQPRDVPPWWMYQCSTVCSERNSGAVHHCVHASGPLKMPLKALITVDVLVPTPLAAQPTRRGRLRCT